MIISLDLGVEGWINGEVMLNDKENCDFCFCVFIRGDCDYFLEVWGLKEGG